MSAAPDIEALAAELSALAETLQRLPEVIQRFVDAPQIGVGLVRINLETRSAGGTVELRAETEITEAARDLLTALRAGNVNLGIVEQAFGHVILAGETAASERGLSPVASPLIAGDAS